MRLVIFAIAIGVLSCSTEDVVVGECGNGIVERGEDCDTPPGGQCEACGIRCGETTDCVDYDPGTTAGFVCGPDGFCHAPSGQFAPAGGDSMSATSVFVTDINQDGIGEVVVQSQTSITAVSGMGSDGPLIRAAIQTPIARGHAVASFVDQDTSLDFLLPTADGIVAYTSEFRVPAPYPFPIIADDGMMGTPLYVQPIAKDPLVDHIVIIGTSPTNELILIVIDAEGEGPPPLVAPIPALCGGSGELAASDIAIYETTPQNLVIALKLTSNDVARLCAINVEFNGTYTASPITFASGIPTSRPVLANLRNGADDCPSLVVAEGLEIVEYKPVLAAACDFANTNVRFNKPTATAGATPVAVVPLNPPLSRQSAIHNTALVLSDGVYAIEPATVGDNQLRQIYVSDRALERAASADIDRDGDDDVIVSGSNNGVASDDLDILDRRGNNDLLRFRFDTEAPVTTFLIGDFDGNEVPDIAFVELHQRLAIAYGTADQLLPGVTVGTFSNVLAVIPTDVTDSTDPNGLISDLAVLFQDSPGLTDPMEPPTTPPTNLTLLHGSPQRTMLAYFDPRLPPPGPGSEFRGVVSGRFSDGSLGNDLVAFEQIGPVTKVYTSTTALNGALSELSTPAGNDGLVRCTVSPTGDTNNPGNGGVCVEDARYLAWPMSSTRDLVVALDTRFQLAAFDPSNVVNDRIVMEGSWPIEAPANSVVVDFQHVSAPDGTPRLLISFGPKSPNAPDAREIGAVKLCTLDLMTGPTCDDVGEMVSAQFPDFPVVCVDAGVARVARAARFEGPDSDGADLVVLCHLRLPDEVSPDDPAMGGFDPFFDFLMRVSFDGSLVEEIRLDLLLRASELQIGDVSGDGIDDIVLIDRSSSVPFVSVLRQCNSREVPCGTITSKEP